MGSLADLRLPTEEIEVPGTGGQTFTVRGLSVADASMMLRLHGEALNGVYAKTVSEDARSPAHIAQLLMQSAPIAVGDIIALAADEPELSDTVRQLPLPVQIEALAAIARLTFHSEQELGELLETVISGSETLTRMIGKMTSTSDQAVMHSH